MRSKHYRVPAPLLVPEGRGQRLPAVVALHDHGDCFCHGKEKLMKLEREHAALKDFRDRCYDFRDRYYDFRDRYYGGRTYADELARRGFVVFVPDAFYWGERRMQYTDPPKQLKSRLSGLQKSEPEYVRAMNSWLRERTAELNTWLSFSGTSWMGSLFTTIAEASTP